MRNFKTIIVSLAVLGVALPFSASAASFIWNGNANDGDWTNGSNWNGGIVLPDFSSNAENVVTFIGGNMPNTNVPDFDGIIENHPAFILQSGGSFVLDYTNAYNQGLIYTNPGTVITVGDGIGVPGTTSGVALTLDNYLLLLRHSEVDVNMLVNSDGILNLGGNFNSYRGNRTFSFTIDGGSIVASGVFSTYTSSSGSTAPYAGVSNAGVTFQSVGSKLTANYGGEFSNLAEVMADANNLLKKGSGIKLEYIDNGTSFTVVAVAVPEVSVLGLFALSAGGLCFHRRR